jgi:hypothetical protein
MTRPPSSEVAAGERIRDSELGSATTSTPIVGIFECWAKLATGRRSEGKPRWSFRIAHHNKS